MSAANLAGAAGIPTRPGARSTLRRLFSPAVGRVLMLIPVVALLGVFLVWPLVDILLRSLDPSGDASYAAPGFSLHNYAEIFRDPVLRSVVTHTFFVAVWASVATTVIAFPVAYLLSRVGRRTALALLTLLILPFWVSILVRLFALTEILGRQGVVNDVVHRIGLGGPYSLLFNTKAVVVGMVAFLLPYMILILYAAMSAVDTSLITAAKTLGATGSYAFRTIYLPLVRASLVSGSLLMFVLSLGFFLTPAILGGAHDTTIPTYIQSQINLFQWGSASAAGVLLLIATLLAYVASVRVGRVGLLSPTDFHAGSRGAAQRDQLRLSVVTLLLWLITAATVVFLLLPLAIVVPTSFETTQMLTWPPTGFTLSWYSQVLHDPLWTSAIKKSATVGAETALLSTAIGLVMARIVSQVRSKTWSSILQAAVYSSLIVPVILLGIGIYDVEARLQLLDTNIGLVLAHTVLAFPLAFAVLNNAIAGCDPSLEAAAWTLGASRRRAFWTVVMPNIVPATLGALLITFVTSWDEAVIALFQTTLNKTLPVTIFASLKSGAQPAIAAVATMLVALSIIGVAVALLIGATRARRRRPVPA
jgi:putative spermidine/putrescine transport system permease protein